MDLTQLNIFVVAASTNSFQKAAEMLYISAPSVTKYIAGLEGELGSPLFVRDSKGVFLTRFGREFLPYAKEILVKEREAKNFAVHFGTGRMGSIRIGMANELEDAPLDSFYDGLIRSKLLFSNRFPEYELALNFESWQEMRAKLNIGSLDIVMFVIPCSEIPLTLPDGMCYSELLRFRHYLAIPDYLPSCSTLEEAVRLIDTLYFVNTPAPKKIFQILCSDFKISPKIISSSHWGEVLMRIVSNHCSGIITENLYAYAEKCGVRLFLLPEERYTTALYAIWVEDKQSDQLRTYLSCLKEAFLAQC